MRKSIMACVMAVVLFGLVVPSQAVRPVGPIAPNGRCFVGFSVKQDVIDLGTIKSIGFNRGFSAAKVDARVVANCPHRVEVSFEPFACVGGRFLIPSKNTSVVINGKDVPVGGRSVPIIGSSRPTPVGGIDVPLELEFELKDVVSYPAGKYEGVLIFTVMGGT